MSRILIVAEIGCNHNGSKAVAKEMVQRAKECGADAVKFQIFNAGALISRYAPKAEYQKLTTGTEESQLEMTRKLELSRGDYLDLREYASGLGLQVFATPFDLDAVAFLAGHGQTIWKIPSGEITNLPYLRKIGSLPGADKRIILSTGMSSIDEIRTCVRTLSEQGVRKEQITLLHCNTEYPTPDKDVNICAILDLKEQFPGMPVGFSDHSKGYVAAVGAAALGISMIEKHFTLNREMEGPDHKASAEPEELRALCENVRRMEVMAGDGKKKVTESERKNKVIARKSIVAGRKIRKGEIFSEENLTCKRPGNGISPMEWDRIMGRRAERDFGEDELIIAGGFNWQE